MSINCVLSKVVWLSFTRIMMHCSFHLISLSQCVTWQETGGILNPRGFYVGFSPCHIKCILIDQWHPSVIKLIGTTIPSTWNRHSCFITTQIGYVGVHAIDNAHDYHKWLEHVHGWFLNNMTSCKSHKRNLCVLRDSYISMADIAMNLM